jgi:hypothetical protein
VIDIPGSLAVELAIAVDIDEVVGIIAKHSHDGEWPLPWKRELVHALPVLDESQEEIALLEAASVDLAAMVAMESLLVDRRTRASKVTCLVDDVEPVLASDFVACLRVVDDSRRFVL